MKTRDFSLSGRQRSNFTRIHRPITAACLSLSFPSWYYVQFGMVGVKNTVTLFSSLSTEMFASYVGIPPKTIPESRSAAPDSWGTRGP